jgi:hypothetical protein
MGPKSPEPGWGHLFKLPDVLEWEGLVEAGLYPEDLLINCVTPEGDDDAFALSFHEALFYADYPWWVGHDMEAWRVERVLELVSDVVADWRLRMGPERLRFFRARQQRRVEEQADEVEAFLAAGGNPGRYWTGDPFVHEVLVERGLLDYQGRRVERPVPGEVRDFPRGCEGSKLGVIEPR